MKETVELTRHLAEIAKENQLAELEYQHGETKIRLIIESERPALAAAAPQVVFAPPMAAPAVAPAPSGETPAVAPAEPAPRGESIDSPLPGVFYRAPSPDSPPFVDEGQAVQAGQTLCIVEAMKLMNEIPAERSCKILKILVKNGEPVEEGQALFLIE